MELRKPAGREWLGGGGEMGARIRAADWSPTPLGPREAWPPALRTALNLVLGCRFAATLLLGAEHRLLYNDAYAEMAADRHPAALGRPLQEAWREIWSLIAPIVSTVEERGETVYLEDALFPIDRHGARVDAYFTVCHSPFRDDAGVIQGSLVTLQETTRQHSRSELERRALAAVIDALPVGIAIADAKGGMQRYNAALARIWGSPPATANIADFARWHGRWSDSRRPLAPDEWAMSRALRKGETVTGDVVDIERFDGSGWATIINTAAPIYNDAGHLVGGVAAEVDITPQREAERELRDSEARFRFLANAVPQVVWTARPDGTVDYYNDRVSELAGARHNADGTWSWQGLVHPDDRQATAKAWAGAVNSGRGYEVAHRVQRADGSYQWYLSRGVPMRDEAGRITRWFGTATNIDAQKRAEAAAREADVRKSEFLAMLSHELRNPLAPIKNGVWVLRNAAPGSERAARAVEVIDRQVTQLTSLVDDLLDVTRISRGKIQLKREPVDLCRVVQAAADDHRPVFEAHGVNLEVQACDTQLFAQGDPTRLTQVIGNLLSNAVKFTPRGRGHVTLAVAREGEHEAAIRVADNGAGIEPGMLPRLFEPFVQADATLARSTGGLGLGLALVKGLVELHGGHVEAASPGPGGGATFTLHLPLAAQA